MSSLLAGVVLLSTLAGKRKWESIIAIWKLLISPTCQPFTTVTKQQGWSREPHRHQASHGFYGSYQFMIQITVDLSQLPLSPQKTYPSSHNYGNGKCPLEKGNKSWSDHVHDCGRKRGKPKIWLSAGWKTRDVERFGRCPRQLSLRTTAPSQVRRSNQ